MTTTRRKLPWYIWAPLVVVLTTALYDMIVLVPVPLTSKPVTIAGPTMGTQYAITLAPTSAAWPPDVAQLKRRVDGRLAEINRLMSTYESESELSRFNRYDGDGWFGVSAETAEVVAVALEIAERSLGAFDPTVGPVVNLWGFGPEKGRVEPPKDDEIAAAWKRVGSKKVSVRLDPPALKKALLGIQIDLSGIAKGHAADAVSDLLDELGYEDSLVVIGGEVRARGRKADDSTWQIGVEQPDDSQRHLQATLSLVNAACSTSGDSHNYFEHQGVRYSHTIDPTTGRPVRHDTATVSIVAATSTQADGLATAALVMGYPQGYAWCLKHDVAAMFLVREKEAITAHATPPFETLLMEGVRRGD